MQTATEKGTGRAMASKEQIRPIDFDARFRARGLLPLARGLAAVIGVCERVTVSATAEARRERERERWQMHALHTQRTFASLQLRVDLPRWPLLTECVC